MSCLPQQRAACRAARIRLPEFTPAVLRFQDGDCTTGNLEVFSRTGGLLNLSKTIDRGSRVKLMFLCQGGPVLGTIEMLRPVSPTRQPFQFLALTYSDQRRLQAATMEASTLGSTPQTVENSRITDQEEEWIEKYRAAITHREKPKRFLRLVLEAGVLATLSLGCVVYLFSLYLR
jgi:hypothetical protein